MIKTPTLLVLGAGASVAAGLPAGKALRLAIIDGLTDRPGTLRKRLVDLGFDEIRVEAFVTSFKQSGKPSVDAFLEHRPDLLDVGKAALAQELIRYEDPARLFDVDGDWYSHLFDKMNSPFNQFGENKLWVVTFNYDRSLEHFLFTALKNTYGKEDAEVAAVMSKIPIIHVHGRLGYLPWQREGGREYTPGSEPLTLASQQREYR